MNGEVFGKAGELPNTLDHIGAAKHIIILCAVCCKGAKEGRDCARFIGLEFNVKVSQNGGCRQKVKTAKAPGIVNI